MRFTKRNELKITQVELISIFIFKSAQNRHEPTNDSLVIKSTNDESFNALTQTVCATLAINLVLCQFQQAYQDWVRSHPVELPLPAVPLTNNQLFFIGFAQVWCSTSTPEAMHLQILNDPHSPAKFRYALFQLFQNLRINILLLLFFFLEHTFLTNEHKNMKSFKCASPAQ